MAVSLLQMKVQFPDPMRQGIVDLLWQNSRVMRLLNFIQNAGVAYAYSATAKLPGVGFRALNADFTATQGTTNPLVETLAILGGKIQTDSVAVSLKGNGVRTNQIDKMIVASAKFFDKNFFNGDPTTAGGGGLGFLGLKKRLSGNQLMTNATDGATIDGDNVIKLQGRVQGSNADKVLLMNQTNRINLWTWATDSTALNRARYIENRPDGTMWFNGSRIEEVYYDETESAILPFTETCGNQSASSSVYCVKFGGESDEQDVQGLSGLPGDIQARGPFDFGTYLVDVVQMVAGIGVFGGYSAARLQGCNAS